MPQEVVRVEIWSDVQCVWCYVGAARWRSALERFDGEVEIVHRSFELQPGAPVEFDAAEFLRSQRGMSARQQEEAFAGMRRVLDAEGLRYEPQRMRPTNSHLALELLHLADGLGLRGALEDRLQEAYFADGGFIGSVDALVAFAAEVGVDPVAARAALEQGVFAAAVDADAAQAAVYGVTGVPFAVVDGTWGVPGAQAADVLVAVLERAAATRAA